MNKTTSPRRNIGSSEPFSKNESIRQSEHRFRMMVEAVKDYAIFMLDPSGHISSWNEGARRIKGYKADEVIGKHFSIFYPPDMLARKWPEHELENARAEGRFEDEGWRLRKDGSRFWANVVITALWSEDRRLVGFSEVTRDLTERKRYEEELRESEQRFRLMVEAVKDYAIFLMDPGGHISSWNEGAQRIKGYSAEEITGKHFSIFYPPEALARDWPQYELEVARAEGRFEDEGWRLRKDGSRFWANVVITALKTGDGTLIGYTKVTRDLTERKRHEEALLRSEQRLEKAYIELSRKNADLQDFTHAASHDLQEPLRKMRTFAELLEIEHRDRLDETGRLYIDRIYSAAHRMSALVSDLLSYSRVETRTQPFQMVDLNSVVEEVLGDLQILQEVSGAKIEIDRLPTLEADRTQMRQLLQNLLGNALKFHRPDHAPVVHISSTPPVPVDHDGREMTTIIVQDNGIGFDEKYLNDIFVPFHRLHALNEYEGTGLGLAICKRIVERHQGVITARSRPGEGATFTVTLPVRQRHMA